MFEKDYTVIGSGGFGIIVKARDQNVVSKLGRDANICASFHQEWEHHKAIYDTVEQFLRDNNHEKVVVPQPFEFNTDADPETVVIRGKTYGCNYTMEYVAPWGADKQIQQHVLFGHETEKPTIYYTNDGIVRYQAADLTGLDTGGIARQMGMLYELVYVSGFVPKDVEFALVRHEGVAKLAMYDFGMVADSHDFDDSVNLEMDIYIPDEDDALFGHFVAGRKHVQEWNERRPPRAVWQGGSRRSYKWMSMLPLAFATAVCAVIPR